MSLIYLADGREIRAETPFAESGPIHFEGRTMTVERFAPPYEFLGYGELVRVKLKGKLWGFILRPEEYRHHVARLYLDNISDPILILLDADTREWREMTDEESALERRAWEADMKDMTQIEREWRNYRNEGLGTAG
jgi:hypothetical protein